MKRKYILIILGILLLKTNSYGQVNLDWAGELGGPLDQQTWTMDVDNQGNVLTAGIFQDTVDFDPAIGTYNLNSVGGYDMFVSKIDPNGNFLWAIRFGGPSSEYLYSISIDDSNHVYITGVFDNSFDADPDTGTSTLTSSGYNDIFVIKLTSNGNLMWAKQIGSSTTHENAFSITSDYSGSVLLTGVFFGTVDFDPGPAVNNLTPHISDVFILRLKSNGDYIWAKNIGGTGYPSSNKINVDNSGNVYTSGSYTKTVDFDPGAGTYNMTADTFYNNSFILKLDLLGDFIWAKEFQSISNSNFIQDFVLDASENIFSCGEFEGITDFDPSPSIYTLNAIGTSHGFITKLDINGNLSWAKMIGENGFLKCHSIDINANYDVYTTGLFDGTVDFDPDTSVVTLTSNAASGDIFISKLDSNGTHLWAYGIGGYMSDIGRTIKVTNSAKIYLTGTFCQTVDFDPNAGVTTLLSDAQYDVFVCKFSDLESIGINEPPANFKLNMFPNPSSGIVTIESDPSILSIYNQTGQMIHNQIISQSITTLDLSNLANGIYLVRLTGEKSGTIKRLVISR